MSSINSRIKLLIQTFAEGNNTAFANVLGVNESTIRSYSNGTEPKINVIEKICRAFPVNSEWLILGFGDMRKKSDIELIQETGASYNNFHPQVITIDSQNRDNIVLVPGKLKAGYLQAYNDPQFIAKLPTYRMPGLNNGVFRMFEMEGNSMFPTIPSNSYVVGQFVENWITGIKDNQVYAIISNELEDGLLKRCVNRIEKYDNLLCKSDNRRNYPTQNISPRSIKEVWEVKLHLNFNLADPTDLYDRMNDLEADNAEIRDILKQLTENKDFK